MSLKLKLHFEHKSNFFLHDSIYVIEDIVLQYLMFH